MSLDELVIEWAKEKGILDAANPLAQLQKTKEELKELEQEVYKMERGPRGEPHRDLLLERGDVEVTLTILDYLLGIDRDTCLRMAYNKIKGRKGKMIDGQFVKEEDL